MNLQHIYDSFIAGRRAREGDLCEYETHHVMPRCLSGGDEDNNRIRLSYSDHLFAHLLLAKIHGGRPARALLFMLQLERYRGRQSRLAYQISRQGVSEMMKGNRLCVGRSRTGWKHTPETRAKMSKARLGKPGPKLNAEQIAAMKQRQIGRKDTPEARANKSLAMKAWHARRKLPCPTH